MTEGQTVPAYYDACVVADLEAKVARLEMRIANIEKENEIAYEAGFDDGYDSAMEERE